MTHVVGDANHLPVSISNGRQRRGGFWQRARSPFFRQNLWGVAFVLPALALLLIFNIYTLANCLYLSLTKWSLAGMPQWVGLGNYITMFTADPEFLRSLKTTLYYALGLNPPMWAIALALALLLNRQMRLRSVIRAVYFTPVVVSWVVAAMVWSAMLHPSFGINAAFFRLFDRPGVDWLHETRFVIPGMIILSLWKSVGYHMVLFLAGLQGIDRSHLEAAAVDGANGWQRLRYVTVPLLRPTLLLVMVVSFIDAFQVFTPILLMTQGGPAGSSRVLPLWIYQNAMEYLKMGYASALAIFLLAILLVFSTAQIRLLRGGQVD